MQWGVAEYVFWLYLKVVNVKQKNFKNKLFIQEIIGSTGTGTSVSEIILGAEAGVVP